VIQIHSNGIKATDCREDVAAYFVFTMEILRDDSDRLHVKLTPDDIIPIGRHPHFGGLRNEVRDLFLGSLPDAEDKPYFVGKPVGVVIAKEIDKPFCIPICCLDFLRREPGGFPTLKNSVVAPSCPQPPANRKSTA
jgi:hypothetical protein